MATGFFDFQDAGAFGRITHLQPVNWQNGWPEMGVDFDGNGIGEPTSGGKKSCVGAKTSPLFSATSDEFDDEKLGLQWQWHAHHENDWASLSARRGWLRLCARPVEGGDLRFAPHFLGQKFPTRQFITQTRLDLSGAQNGDIAGLAVLGGDGSAALGLRRTPKGGEVVLLSAQAPQVLAALPNSQARLRAQVAADGLCQFAFAADEESGEFHPVEVTFCAREGGWIGAKIGLFAQSAELPCGTADFDLFALSVPG